LVSGSVGGKGDVVVDTLAFEGGLEERRRTHSIAIAGDGSTLAYADADDGAEETPDRGVRRLVGGRSIRIPGALGAFALAASRQRLAILSDTNRTSLKRASNFAATWSPTGDRIAYAATPEGDFRFSAIKTAAADGTNPTKVTNQTLGEYRADFDPDWSPAGPQIAFMRQEVSTNNQAAIWTMNADGSNQKTLVRGADPAWSPDGIKIAFRCDTGGICVINADGSGLRQLTSNLIDSGPDWSPDGMKLVFSSSTPQSPNEIRVMNPDGTNVQDVAAGREPAWSADGRIAFTRGADPDTSEVRVVNPDGGNDHRVGTGHGPSWSPDSTWLAVTRTPQGSSGSDIFLLRADGSAESRLTTAKLEPIAPTLQLRDARNGRLIARVAYGGQGKAVALSPLLVAVLAKDAAGTHVALYDARSGSPAGIVRVRGNATDLSISGNRVVFRSGRSIWLLDALKKHVSLLATAATVPVGLSIDGRRVAWAENLRRGGRIRALEVR
jgi:Tol biopolymer transport system component